MNEQEWLSSVNPGVMLEHLMTMTSSRKHGLFVCACARREVIWQSRSRNFRKAIRIFEQHMDGSCKVVIRQAVEKLRNASESRKEDTFFVHVRNFCECPNKIDLIFLLQAIDSFTGDDEQILASETPAQISLLRDIFGNPFQPITINPNWLSWSCATVVALAQAAYDERQLPSGNLDPELLAILADALEDAGCTDQTILQHLRSHEPHVRGCWVLDLLFGKQ